MCYIIYNVGCDRVKLGIHVFNFTVLLGYCIKNLAQHSREITNLPLKVLRRGSIILG